MIQWMVPQTPLSPEIPSYEELLERVARLERLLLEMDRRIAELERLKGSAKETPKPPGRKIGTQYGRQTIARTARKRHLDGVRILADLLRAPHEIVHPALLIASG
jgi:hypothetical protein